MHIPPYLNSGDTVAIVAPAKYIEEKHVLYAKQVWEDKGFKVIFGKNAVGQYNYFSGTIQQRLEDIQAALNDDNVKAIICARGGYGCLDLVDTVNWAGMITHPKWIIGFSDVTVFHQRLNRLNTASLHATMPLNYKENSEKSLTEMFQLLAGKSTQHQWKSNQFKTGETRNIVLGGNLSILHNLIGTNDMPDYSNTILYVEEVGEYLYAIDRMFYAFSKAGILDKISGLLVGAMTSINDTEVKYGATLEEIILKHFSYNKIPVAFNFKAGHINDNRPIILGKEAQLVVLENGLCTFSQ